MADFVDYSFQVQIFPGAVDQLVRAPGGPVDKEADRLAKELLKTAKEIIDEKATFRGHHRSRGGGIAASGSIEKLAPGERLVVFDHPYALGLHEGAQPHFMPPRPPERPYMRRRPQPVSYSAEKIFATYGPINHPGHAPFFYLTRAASIVGLRSQGQLFSTKSGRSTPMFSL